MTDGVLKPAKSRARIDGALSRRGESVAALYDAHLDELYRFVYRRCRDHALTQDITQETFLAAARCKTDPEALTMAWLVTVARRRLFDVLRKRTRDDDKLRRLINSAATEESFDITEQIRVENALNLLSVDHRLVLTLHYFDGFAVKAIAQQLERSPKSVEGLITRARAALRAALSEQGGEGL